MTQKASLLLATLAICCIATSYALPMEGIISDLKCRCVRYTSAYINPRNFRHIEIIPQGARCRRTEIIVTLRNNNIVCVDPQAQWINQLISNV
uniref:C-X-C motif chemokine 13-like n=1 Tax=Lepisosteus oculatus TaxID=7918 RepID=W5M671_LEPOC